MSLDKTTQTPPRIDEVQIERWTRGILAGKIDDIRSTAKYRTAIAANLLEEFLRTL